MLVVLIVGRGPAAHGTTPGTNGAIAFAADQGFGSEIYTINPDGTGFRQLTNVDGNALAPEWSPDGRRIAFTLEDGDHSSVVIMEADGTHMRDLTPPTGYEAEPAFTPDGHHLVFEWCNCLREGIFIMRDDGTHRRRLTTHAFPSEPDSGPNVSPDGRTVTFVRHKVDGELLALFAVDIDGGNERKIAPYTLELSTRQDWAPDGQHIVITTNADYPEGRPPNVATIRPDGSHLRMLTNYTGGEQGAFAGSYSPDGRWIVVRVENLDSESFGLYKMRPDGSDRRLIASMPFAARASDWGPLPEDQGHL
jgi:Tol biopolymer transport system component